VTLIARTISKTKKSIDTTRYSVQGLTVFGNGLRAQGVWSLAQWGAALRLAGYADSGLPNEGMAHSNANLTDFPFL
jgi:hypothetical protein